MVIGTYLPVDRDRLNGDPFSLSGESAASNLLKEDPQRAATMRACRVSSRSRLRVMFCLMVKRPQI